MRRTQIYLDDEQAERLDRRASAAGVTRSSVIRLAVDEYLEGSIEDSADWKTRWQKALKSTAGIAPDLPEGREYVDELRAADAGRLAQFER